MDPRPSDDILIAIDDGQIRAKVNRFWGRAKEMEYLPVHEIPVEVSAGIHQIQRQRNEPEELDV